MIVLAPKRFLCSSIEFSDKCFDLILPSLCEVGQIIYLFASIKICYLISFNFFLQIIECDIRDSLREVVFKFNKFNPEGTRRSALGIAT